MTNASDPTKRVPKSLGTDTQFLGKYSLADLVVGGLPAAVVILVTQVVLPQSLAVGGVSIETLTIPAAVAAMMVGGVFVYLTPEHTSSLDWFERFLRFRRRDSRLGHEAATDEPHVERIYPQHDAVERTDGALVGAIHVSPPTMALATDAEWEQKADAFEDFVNTTLEFPIQIYSTTQAFPADEYVGRYQSRLDDSDVQSNETLRALIEHYVDWYDRELAQRQMTIREHYVIVPVDPGETHHEQDSPLQRLADVPVVGSLLRLYSAPPVAEERARQIDELTDRRRRVERGLRNIDGCDTRPVGAIELTYLVAEYWSGTDIEYGNPDRVMRTTPLVTGY